MTAGADQPRLHFGKPQAVAAAIAKTFWSTFCRERVVLVRQQRQVNVALLLHILSTTYVSLSLSLLVSLSHTHTFSALCQDDAHVYRCRQRHQNQDAIRKGWVHPACSQDA